jgi:hypothetical protein
MHTSAALAATILMTGPQIKAQSWETVLNYQYVAGTAAGGRSIAADASGNVFSGGYGNDASGIAHGTVFRTDTSQASWYFSDDTNPSAAEYRSYIRHVGLDANGNWYSIGQLFPLTPDNSGIPYWYVRKSSDNGLQWSIIDTFQYAPGQWVNPTGFAADDSGNIYVAGWARAASTRKNQPGNLHWLVRRSTDAGQKWELVDDLEGPQSGFGVGGAGFVRGAGIFVVGDEFTGGPGWRVRRSISGDPGTWSTVDGPIAYGAAAGVGSDSQGNIYVVGSMFITTATKPKLTGYYAWATRKSNDGGITWSTVDSFSYAPNQSADANGIGRNSAGDVVVVGGATDAQGKRHWIVRTHDSSVSWRTVDDYVLAPGYWAGASGVATDATGNLLVSGAANDATGGHWIVRRLANTAR